MADVVVLPYEKTYQSGVILSAYQFKKPVLTSRVGGIPEIVEEGKSGFLFNPGDIETHVDRVTMLLKDYGLRKK